MIRRNSVGNPEIWRNMTPLLLAALTASLTPLASMPVSDAMASPVIERITTKVPVTWGLVMLDDRLYVARGRMRDAGGASTSVNDMARTVYVVDPKVTEPVIRAYSVWDW